MDPQISCFVHRWANLIIIIIIIIIITIIIIIIIIIIFNSEVLWRSRSLRHLAWTETTESRTGSIQLMYEFSARYKFFAQGTSWGILVANINQRSIQIRKLKMNRRNRRAHQKSPKSDRFLLSILTRGCKSSSLLEGPDLEIAVASRNQCTSDLTIHFLINIFAGCNINS